jgi:hypothetical protein
LWSLGAWVRSSIQQFERKIEDEEESQRKVHQMSTKRKSVMEHVDMSREVVEKKVSIDSKQKNEQRKSEKSYSGKRRNVVIEENEY